VCFHNVCICRRYTGLSDRIVIGIHVVLCVKTKRLETRKQQRMWCVSMQGSQNHSLVTSIVTYCQLVMSMASQIVTYKIVFAFCWNAFQWINKLASGVATHSTVSCILHLTMFDFHQLVKIQGVYKRATLVLTWKTNTRWFFSSIETNNIAPICWWVILTPQSEDRCDLKKHATVILFYRVL